MIKFKMHDNRLTNKDKWEKVWAGIKLPHIQTPDYDLQTKLKTFLPRIKTASYSLIEIGCAPGGWMAYFNNHFGYRVSGIEYAENAAGATKQNMEMLEIDADIIVDDFFSFDSNQNNYDVVFSAGFIEHFQDLALVMEKICALSNRFVVTIVPNCYGVNAFISKTIRPKVWAEHTPINVNMLDRLHTSCGIRTLFCDYVGGARLIMPGVHNDYFAKHKYCSRAVNLPVQVFNHLSENIGRFFHFIPRTRLLSASILYIGCK